jgi:hypothetical protein
VQAAAVADAAVAEIDEEAGHELPPHGPVLPRNTIRDS